MNSNALMKLQHQLDEKKWIGSQINKKDMCGHFLYCKYCNKRNKYPCATAYIKFNKNNEGK